MTTAERLRCSNRSSRRPRIPSIPIPMSNSSGARRPSARVVPPPYQPRLRRLARRHVCEGPGTPRTNSLYTHRPGVAQGGLAHFSPPRRTGAGRPRRRRTGAEPDAGPRSQRFENWKLRRALRLPYFLRSTTRASRVRKPPCLRSEEHTSELQSPT